MKLDTIQPKPVVCRQSCISCALACEMKWFLKYRLGVRLRGAEVKEGATLGKIYHKFQQFGPGRENEVLLWVREKQKVLMDRADKGEDLDGSTIRLANLMTDLYHKAEAMAHLFWERYPQPDYLRTVGTEIKISGNLPYGLIGEGTIDKLLQNEKDERFWVRDHKSTGMSLNTIFGGLKWSIQARLYRILVTGYLFGKDSVASPIGFIMDGILRPGIKLCKTDDKNAKTWKCSVEDAYLRRVKEWYKEKDQDAMLSRAMIYDEPLYPDELIKALSLMRDLSVRPIELKDYSRDITRAECFKYNTQCIYHDLCSTDLSQWDSLFETKYKIEEVKDDEIETEGQDTL
jgi:hypothetical protein